MICSGEIDYLMFDGTEHLQGDLAEKALMKSLLTS